MPALWFVFHLLTQLGIFLTIVQLRTLYYFILSAVSRLTNPIAKWDIKGTQAVLLQPFSPIVVAADENECIRYAKFVNTVVNLVDTIMNLDVALGMEHNVTYMFFVNVSK
jgi:hypothetical protein